MSRPKNAFRTQEWVNGSRDVVLRSTTSRSRLAFRLVVGRSVGSFIRSFIGVLFKKLNYVGQPPQCAARLSLRQWEGGCVELWYRPAQ
jgi:hypothetical protein